MILGQLEFLNTAISKLDGSPLFWMLVLVIVSVLLMQFKDLIRSFSDAFIERKKMQLKFDEDAQKEKFERENKTAEALLLNAESLREATYCLKCWVDKCNRHSNIVEKTVNDAIIDDNEKKNIIEAVRNKDV